MAMCASSRWERYKRYLFNDQSLGFSIDISRMNFDLAEFNAIESQMGRAFQAMEQLEQGGLANPDEGRMVGHYWLRAPSLAPTLEIRQEIEKCWQKIRKFAADLHAGLVKTEHGERFSDLLLIGIGGSALGPQLVSDALGSGSDKLSIHYMDNTDPDGMARTLAAIPDLAKLLVIVISKSGGTKETRNGQLVARAALEKSGLRFNRHFVAVTMDGSDLYKTAQSEQWLATFPLWDWVGGRTSLWGAVGLLPATLQGFDTEAFLAGAAEMDVLTRRQVLVQNPAALLAAMWFHAGKGVGQKAMVTLPYKDRLLLLSRYLQQLVMESLGKERNLEGAKVNQGLVVYGNKGSTDQHAYVQQLRDGLNNFFAVFVEVLNDYVEVTDKRFIECTQIEVEPGVNCGDFLEGFYLGTRSALYESGRESVTITINQLNARSLGAMIALFERTVGFYATLIGVNAYNQPGVEAGKRAATRAVELQKSVLEFLRAHKGSEFTVDQLCSELNGEAEIELVFKLLQRLAAVGRVKFSPSVSLFEGRYCIG